MTDQPATPADAWLARLAGARSTLLRALEGVTEREFAAPFDGDRSLVHVLAALAVEERAAVARARGEESTGRVPEKPLAPQVIHDLAGARYGTERLLAEAAVPPDRDTRARFDALVDEIARREETVAAGIMARIAARPAE